MLSSAIRVGASVRRLAHMHTALRPAVGTAARTIRTTAAARIPELPGVPSREECIARMRAGEEFDLLVVGGGSTGAGAALDAATRGLKVAMVEQEDFSSGTSSRSTKLIWAGSRYLVQALVKLFGPATLKAPIASWKEFKGNFNMVMGAHRERRFLLETQPHLTNWLPIAVPMDKWILWPPPFAYPPAALGAFGMFTVFFKFYDALAKFSAPSSYILSAKKAYRAFPQLDQRLKYCQVFFEGQHNDARTNIAIALTAAEQGAAVANYAKVSALTKDDAGRVNGAIIDDLMDDGAGPIELKAKQVLFCGGPFTDSLRKMEDAESKDAVTGAGGIHVVLPAYYSPQAMGMVDMATSDGRFLFFLPWLGHTLVGTTDHEQAPTMRPIAAEDEIQWVINEASKYMSPDLQVRRQDVLSAWSGIRGLMADPNASSTASASRDHICSYNPKSGVVFLAGGKWTTYREMAEDGIDKCIEVGGLKPTSGCRTLQQGLIGRDGYSKHLAVQLIQDYGVTERTAKHLAKSYGGRAHDVLKFAKPTGLRYPRVGTPLVPGYPYIEAEVRYAAREYARTAMDVLARRTRLAFLNSEAARDAAPRVIELLGGELGWDDAKKEQELADTMEYMRNFGGPIPDKEGAMLRQATMQDLRDVFDSIDTDGSGTLSREELRVASDKLGFRLDKKELDEAMAAMDLTLDGEVDFEEFAAWWNSEDNNQLWASMRAEFAMTSSKMKDSTGVMFG